MVDLKEKFAQKESLEPEPQGVEQEGAIEAAEQQMPVEEAVTGVAAAAETPSETPVSAPTPVAAIPAPKDELTQEIEEVLAEDLGEMYQKLPPDKKQQFKVEGEKAAGLIRQMMEKGKLHTHRILKLIRRWLRMIPGVNRFFLEQESKIKTDRILMIDEEQKQKRL